MKRIVLFLRSVLPVDLWRLVFLAGVVLVFVCGHANWWPALLLANCGAYPTDMPSQAEIVKFRYFTTVLLYPTIFSGIAGYFACFWPGKKPLRRLLCAVWLPSAIASALYLRSLYDLCKPSSVIFHATYGAHSFFDWLKANTEYMPAGPALCAAGLLFILFFAVRLALGKSGLPLEVKQENVQPSNERWARARNLASLLIALYSFLAGILGLVVSLPAILAPHPSAAMWEVTADIVSVLEAPLLVAAALVVMKRSWRDAVVAAFRWPRLLNVIVAAAIPIGVTLLFPAGHYLFDRVQWAAHDLGRHSPLMPSAYFDVSNMWHLVGFLWLFSSTAEEVVFRGMLLPNFVARYGAQRGIFFVGIVWAAVHFRSDSYSRMSFTEVVTTIATRICICLTLNYILSWMTLRQGSVTCAAITHGLWNLLNFIPQSALRGELEVRILLLGVIAVFLFWFWPIGEPVPARTVGTVGDEGSALAT